MNDPRAHRAWRGALTACLLNAVASPLDALIGRGVAGMPLWVPLSSSAVGAVLAGLLLARRGRASARFCSLLFVVNAAVIVAGLWQTNTTFALGAERWSPYQASKLGALASGLLAADVWAGCVTVSLFAGSALAHYASLPAGVRARLFDEPWATIGFGLFGLAVVFVNVRRLAAELEMEQARAHAAALARLARASLDVRDLASTPVQTITFALALLRRQHPEAEAQLTVIARALERLEGLGDVLRTYEAAAGDPIEGDEGVAFDALTRLGEPSDARGGPRP